MSARTQALQSYSKRGSDRSVISLRSLHALTAGICQPPLSLVCGWPRGLARGHPRLSAAGACPRAAGG
eukprot:2066578-Pyramimonas_sp.AAC.1